MNYIKMSVRVNKKRSGRHFSMKSISGAGLSLQSMKMFMSDMHALDLL